jgi:hypothetical protein
MVSVDFTPATSAGASIAFVGLSRIRETAIFGGAPIAVYHEELKWRRLHRDQHGQRPRDAAVRQRGGGDLRRAGRPRSALSDLRPSAR